MTIMKLLYKIRNLCFGENETYLKYHPIVDNKRKLILILSRDCIEIIAYEPWQAELSNTIASLLNKKII